MAEFELPIKAAIEATPFESTPERTIFSKWCAVNLLDPCYVSREEWNERKQEGVVQSDPYYSDDVLLLPKDLKLWEMIDIIEAVDTSQAASGKRKEFYDLGDSFVNAGIYLAQNLSNIPIGTSLAVETAQDFYRYGNALRTGRYDENASIDEIAENVLSPKQVEEIDVWFGVNKIASLKHENRNEARSELLRQYFKVAEETKTNELHQRGIHRSYRRVLEEPLHRPQSELENAVLRHGVDKVLSEMGQNGWREDVIKNFKEIGVDLEENDHTLREILDIPRLRSELMQVRQRGDVAAISEKEREVAFSIQTAVSKLPYERANYRPKTILSDQAINCLGSSLLGSRLLDEVGIEYLSGDYPHHSVTFLITTDKKVYYQDFLNTDYNFEITAEEGYKRMDTGEPVTGEDILAVKEGLSHVLSIRRKKKAPIRILPAEIGLKCQVLGNLGSDLIQRQTVRSAIALLEYELALDKNNSGVYVNLSNAYGLLGDEKKEYEFLTQALKLYPEDLAGNYNLGLLLRNRGEKEKAIQAFEHVLTLHEESQNDNEENREIIARTKRRLAELTSK